jgi:hypothetical protein
MRRTLITVAALVSAVALLSGATLALASPGPVQPDRTRIEHFRIISTVAPAKSQSLLATGSFVAGGTMVVGAAYDKVHLYHGSFRLYPVVTYRSAPQPPSRCLFSETERGTYRIRDGSGRYRRLTGSGRFSTQITGVLASTGKNQCGHMVAFQQITYAAGRVHR